ncbi:MAG: hypothetical protein PHR62_14345 [Paludibacter sp.]|jgi:hypothetical protein|nr:hypothetical protein [Paludibacter sp.]
MKTTLKSLIVLIAMAAGVQLQAQNRITVEAYNNDISYYLDLKAVASVFGDSRDLEDFERRINDYDSGISNLDLNGDGYIDYLRVIETSENNVHLVVIQAVLDRDTYQDVASIVVERDRYRKTYVQVIGDPFLYGHNYIIEPVYYRTPALVRWFWTPRYHRWVSPYYWGYYPRYYRYRSPLEINIYMSNVHRHINVRHNYRYNDHRRNDYSLKMHSSVGRNDYGVRYPDRNFSKRNSDVRNKADFNSKRDYNRSGQNNGVRQSNGNNSYNEGVRRSENSRQINNNTRDYQTRERSGENNNQSGVRNRDNNSYQNGTRNTNVERNEGNRGNQERYNERPKPESRPTVTTPRNERPNRNSENVKKSEPAQRSTGRSTSVQSKSENKSRQSSVQSSSRSSNSNNKSTRNDSNRSSGNKSSRSGNNEGGRR